MMMFSVLMSRVLGLVRDRVIAMKFGQGFETDAYNAAFTVPDLLSYVIAGGAISSAVIPVFTEYIHAGKQREAWRIFSVVAIVTTWSVSALIIIGEIFAWQLVAKLNPGAKFEPNIPRTVFLTRILLPAQLCFFLGGLMMGVLQTKDVLFGQAIGPIIYNLGIIFGGTVLIQFAPADNRIVVLCWGALIGAFIGNIVIQWALIRRVGGYFVPKRLKELLADDGVKAGSKQVWVMMLPILLGVALPQIAAITNKYFASYLTSGAQSALMNANRMMQVPLGVFAQATAIAIFPTMAAQYAQRDIKALRSTTNYGLRFIFFMTIPASALMIVLALPIVQLLLQSGKYSAINARDAAAALQYYSIGIFAWSGHSILARAFYSVKNTKVPVIVGTIATLLFIPMNRPLMELLGFRGLALATTIASALNMFALLILIRVRLRGIEGGKLLISVIKTIIASLTAAVVSRVIYSTIWANVDHDANVFLHALIILTICLGAGTVVYLAACSMMKMEEMKSLTRLFDRMRGKLTGRPASPLP
jgi:putative peptidoglycan lipid II flippase